MLSLFDRRQTTLIYYVVSIFYLVFVGLLFNQKRKFDLEKNEERYTSGKVNTTHSSVMDMLVDQKKKVRDMLMCLKLCTTQKDMF